MNLTLKKMDKNFLEIVSSLREVNESLINKHRNAQNQMRILAENYRRVLQEVKKQTKLLSGFGLKINESLTILKLVLSQFLEKIPPEAARAFENEFIFIDKVVQRTLELIQIDNEEKFSKINFTAISRAACGAVRNSSHRWRVKLENGIFVTGKEEFAETAILNLLENAQSFTPRTKEIAVNLTRENKRAVLTVEDQGVGFSPEEKTLIFEKFYSNPLKKTQRRTGLGLPLAKKVFEKMGGEISVGSAENIGSTFKIELPLA